MNKSYMTLDHSRACFVSCSYLKKKRSKIEKKNRINRKEQKKQSEYSVLKDLYEELSQFGAARATDNDHNVRTFHGMHGCAPRVCKAFDFYRLPDPC